MFSAHVRIFVSIERVDLRVSFDRLAGIVRERFGEDPRGGSLFVFLNRERIGAKSYSTTAADTQFFISVWILGYSFHHPVARVHRVLR